VIGKLCVGCGGAQGFLLFYPLEGMKPEVWLRDGEMKS